MTVQIDSITYHAFYDVLKIAFLKLAFPPDGILPAGWSADAQEIWKETDKEGRYWIYHIAGDYPNNPLYFSRMRSVIKTIDGMPTEHGINALAMYNALIYLDYKLPDNIAKNAKFPKKEKAKILIKKFKDHVFGTERSSPREYSDLKIACHTVETFYQYLAKEITNENTKNAWNLLSPTFQNREVWEGNYDRFHEGYKTTLALRGIHAFNPVKTTPDTVECKVFYEDEVLTYPINGMSAIKTMTVAEMYEFVRAVEKIKIEIEKKGGKNFDNIPLNKLFDPTGMEFIWYECGFRGNELHRFFAKPHSEIAYRLYDCYLVSVKGKWLINNITPVKTYSVR